jgi:magnesium and cobalt transporter
MGIVVDEFGVACGIVTIEDIVEEIVSGINEEINIESINEGDNTLIFDAKTYLDDFYDMTGIDLNREEVETLGGVINLAMGRIARKGEKITYNGITFEVIEASDRAVKKLKLMTYKKEQGTA